MVKKKESFKAIFEEMQILDKDLRKLEKEIRK